MKHTCKIILLVLCVILLITVMPAGAYKGCTCLDENGNAYSESASGDSKCYSCSDENCSPNGSTLDQCRDKSSESKEEKQTEPAPEPKKEKPAESAPEPKKEKPAEPAPEPKKEKPAEPAPEPKKEKPAEPAPEPKKEKPAEPAPEPKKEKPAEPAPEPKKEKPAEPAPEPASVVEQPAPAPAPVVEQPAPAPVVEQPAPAPVVEQPAPAPAPVVEQPAPAPAPVVEQPAPAPAPVVEQPAPALAPVVEQPAPVPAPVVEQPAPAPAPVVEQPAPAPAPVVEQPAPAPAPVVEQPAPAPAPVVEQPAPAPALVVEQPAPAPAPVAEQPAPVFGEQEPFFTSDNLNNDSEGDNGSYDGESYVPAPNISYNGVSPDPSNDTDNIPVPVLVSSEDATKDSSIIQVPILTVKNDGSDVEGVASDNKSAPILAVGNNSNDTDPDDDGTNIIPIPVLTVGNNDGNADPDNDGMNLVPIPVLSGGSNNGNTDPDDNGMIIVPIPVPTEDNNDSDTDTDDGTNKDKTGLVPVIVQTDDGNENKESYDTETLDVKKTAEPSGAEETPETTAPSETEVTPDASETPEPIDQKEGISLRKAKVLGELKELYLSEPNGIVVTKPNVNLVWVYSYDTATSPTEVTFSVEMTIKDTDTSDVINITETVSSAKCQGLVCSYSVGNELSGHKNATVSWDVSAGSIKTENGPFSFTLKITDSTPTPTSTLTSTPTPTKTATPTPAPKPGAPILECPLGEYHKREIGFYWAPSANAETYVVHWKDNKNHSGTVSLSNSDSTCKKGRCIAHAKMPGTGNYTWYVVAKNKSGEAKSKSMKFEIGTNISTPRPYSPNSTITNNNYPAFEWEDVHDGAVEYRIQVVGKYDNRIRMDRWFRVNDIYVGNGVCYVQTDLFLPAGTYCWRVQARNKSFSSGWSEWRDFTVQYYYYTTNVNTIPSVSYPVGTITKAAPDFQWRQLTGAAYYQVKVYNESGQILLDERVPSSNCSGDLCTWKPAYQLPANGNYRWTVSGYGSNGTLWNSSSGSFTLQAPVVLKPMSFLSPVQNGYLSEESKMVIWTDPGEAGVAFTLEIYNKNNDLLFSASLTRSQAWCDGISCAIEFKSIPDDVNYRIRVTPYTEYLTVGDPIELVFNKGIRPMKLNSPKEGSIVTSRPLFRWSLDAGADAQYDLMLTDANNNSMTYSPLICGAEGVNCEETEGFFSPAQPIPAGTYTARIGISGTAAMGEPLQFTIR